jgi:hypothetical protein
MAQSIRLGIEALLFWVASRRVASLSFTSLITKKQIQSLCALFVFISIGTVMGHFLADAWLRLAVISFGFGSVGIMVWRYSLSRPERDKLGRMLKPLVVKS